MGDILLSLIQKWDIETWKVSLIIWVILLLLLVFWYIWTKINNRVVENKKKLVYQYDKLFYHLAEFQKAHPQSKTNTYVMESLFDLPEPNYIHNYNLIVGKIEGLKWTLNESAVPQAELSKLKKLSRQMKTTKFFEIIFSIIICLLTVLLIFIVIRVFMLK